MSNILKVTSPAAGFENSNSAKINNHNLPNKQVQGPVIPDKIVRPDARSDAASDQSEAALKFKYKTNYDNFVQQVAKASQSTKDVAKIFTEKFVTIAESGISTKFAEEVSKFLSMIEMTEGDLAAFLKMQEMSSLKFKGTFFDILRNAFFSASSADARAGIIDFLKKYTDMAEGDHLLNQMKYILKQAKQGMFSNARNQMNEIENLMNYSANNGDVEDNARLIKERILPFLNEYVKATHDRGILRESAAELAVLTARYENGDAQGLLDAFRDLLKMPMFAKLAENSDPDFLSKIILNTDFMKASQSNSSMMKLAELVQRGVNGEGGPEATAAFKMLMQGMLLNESVYMPLMHMMLPVNVNGRVMYSELWIDPDAEGSSSLKNKDDKIVKGLVKFDIQDVGFFDLFFMYSKNNGGNVSVQLHYPEALEKDEKKIASDIARIIEKNNLKLSDMVLGAGKISIPVSEAFEDVFERRSSINVRI